MVSPLWLVMMIKKSVLVGEVRILDPADWSPAECRAGYCPIAIVYYLFAILRKKKRKRKPVVSSGRISAFLHVGGSVTGLWFARAKRMRWPVGGLDPKGRSLRTKIGVGARWVRVLFVPGLREIAY